MSGILEKNALIDGRYRVERFIGAGGMGAVYRVRDLRKDGQVVALKMLSPSSDGQAIQRFRREFYTLSRLSHPNLAAVFESGAHGRSPYFTMEYLSGWTLERALASPRSALCAALRHEIPTLMTFLSQVCSALTYIHALGVVHRDLKPSNLMLSRASGDLRVKLMDMGLAAWGEEIDLTKERGLTGTVHYVSPEQVRGTGVDQRSDLYSLGVVLYEILTGRPPFDGESLAEVALKHIRETPIPPRQHQPDIPAVLQQVVLTLLEKEPVSRYPSAEELLSALSPLGGPGPAPEGRPLKATPPLLRPRFVGRAEELAVLRRLLSDASEGRGRLVVLSGEAGIGKTALLDEARAQARLSGFHVLSGAGRGPSQAPLHPLTEALRGWLQRIENPMRSPRAVRSLSPEVRAQVARLLPELAPREDASRPSSGAVELFSGEEGQRLLNALVRLFSEQSRRRRVALFLEDLQEADEQTLEFLTQLTDSLDDLPMLACVSLRTGEAGEVSAPLLLRDAERRRIVHLSLPRLTHAEVVQLVASMLGGYDVPEPVGRWLFERTEGNPLFAAEMTKALVESGAMFVEGEALAYMEEQRVGVPDTVQQVIRRRLTGLDPATAEVLSYGAVIGRSFEFDLLMAASRREEMALIDALERLRRAQVVREEMAKAVYHFTHPMLQEVVYEDIPRERRRRFHREVAEAIERLQAGRTGEVAEVLAHHFSEAREVEKAIPYLKEAGDQAGELYSISNAIEHYEKALRLIQVNHLTHYTHPEGHRLPVYLDTLCNYAYILRWAGRWEEGHQSIELVLDLAVTEDTARQRAKALTLLSGIYLTQGEREKAIKVAREAQKLYHRLGDREGEAFTLHKLSFCYWHKRNYRYGKRCIEQAAEKYKSMGGKLNEIKSLQMLARAYSMRGDLLKVEECHRAALAICDEIGDESIRYFSIPHLRQIYLLRGRFRLAEKYVLMEQTFFRKEGLKWHMAGNLINLGDIYLECGELAKAKRQYEDALEMLLSLQERYKACVACCRLSEVALRSHDLVKAIEYVRQGRALAAPDDILRQNQTWRVMGMVKAAIGEVEEAERCFQKSIEVVGGNPIYDLGLSYLEAGRFYRTTGNKQKAIRHLKKAHQLFTRMGATHFARKATGELEKVMKKRPHNGRTPSSRSKKPPERSDESPEPPAETALDRLVATDRLRTLYEVSVALTSIRDLDALLNRCIDLLLETTRAERGLILLAEPGEELTVRACRARRMDDREAAQISYSLVRDAMASGRPLRAADAASDPRFTGRQSVVDFRIRSVMCTPLIRSGRVVGALYVDHRRIADAFTEGDEEFLKAFGSLAVVAIENAEIHQALTQRALHLQEEAERRYAFGSLIGGSEAMQKVYALISNAAGHGMTALISGETGVGKELVARSIHYNSPRKQGPFIVQDCGAMPPGLLESELFGHRRGAYTGAVEDRAGLFEAAHGGTLFLDEIGSAPPEVQARLLRVLQEGEVRRVGETKARKVDVRVIAATNRDLQGEVRAGRFREDLFYRLSAFPIPIPPLRDRREDIPMLAGHFLKESGRALKKEVRGIGKEAMALLLDYAWPGNVRELENEIRRAVTLTPDGGEIGPEALSDRVRGRAAQAVSIVREGATWKETVEQVERAVIRDALAGQGYNVTRTAEALGISRVTLQQKMKRYGLRE